MTAQPRIMYTAASVVDAVGDAVQYVLDLGPAVMMPIIMQKLNPRMLGPPKMYMISRISRVVIDVINVRANVWLILLLMISGVTMPSRPRVSRMRSNTTMVSLIE